MLPRRPHRLIIALIASACAMVAAPGAQAAETLTVTDPVTDNYKAQFNADPSVREKRTYLSFTALGASATTWAPTTPGSIIVTSSAVAVKSADGRTGSITMRVTQGGATVQTRYDDASRAARFGPLVFLSDPDAIAATPVRIELTLTVGGAALATGTFEYRDEPAFDNVASDHLEYNGPGGRWYVGGRAIRTDWEPKPATPVVETATQPTTSPASTVQPTVYPPKITRLIMPLRVRSPRVTIGIRGSAVGASRIKYARIQVGSGRWSRWTLVRPSFTVKLRNATATTRIRVQLRNAAGQNSKVAQRYVRCLCG